MDSKRLAAAIAECFAATNGDHAMTAEDDAYVSEWFMPLEDLASQGELTADELRRLMLSNRLPLPSYIRSDGTQMVPHDLLDLPRRAGGFEELAGYLGAHFDNSAEAISVWDAYLAGQYVCLRTVSPENMKRKDELVEAIEAKLGRPQPQTVAWRAELKTLVDELDELEPPFAPYDRLRFGGPVSRDRLITDVRKLWLDAGPALASNATASQWAGTP